MASPPGLKYANASVRSLTFDMDRKFHGNKFIIMM